MTRAIALHKDLPGGAHCAGIARTLRISSVACLLLLCLATGGARAAAAIDPASGVFGLQSGREQSRGGQALSARRGVR